MKKLLMIMCQFPGYGGSRNVKLFKYLPKINYNIFVITNKGVFNSYRSKDKSIEKKVLSTVLKGKYTIYRTLSINKSPFRVFSKFFNSRVLEAYFDNFFFIPDLFITWIPSVIIKTLKIIKREKIDTLITTSPPESTHIAGLILKKFTGITWIADLRDLWTTKRLAFAYDPPTIFHDLTIRKIEKTIYKYADHIIANTHGNKEIYIKEFNVPSEKITVTTNG